MRSGRTWESRAAALWLALALTGPSEVLGQELIPRETLDEWFYSRLLWGVLLGGAAGLVAGLAHLCRLQYDRRALNVNGPARRKYLGWVAGIFLVGAVLLLLDAWLLYDFSALSLAFTEALSQVWLNYRMLMVLLATLAVFTIVVAISTRLKPDCSCRYAFLPGPRGK